MKNFRKREKVVVSFNKSRLTGKQIQRSYDVMQMVKRNKTVLYINFFRKTFTTFIA